VKGGLSEEGGVLLWGHTQLIVEVSDDAVLDGVLEGEDTPLALSLITHVAVFLTHPHHHTLKETVIKPSLTSSLLMSSLENVSPGMSPRFLSQKIEAKDPEKKMPSTAAKATTRSPKDTIKLSQAK
ncbi:hypothetical protein DNTS_011346, partial [Danionella cerebrum]